MATTDDGAAIGAAARARILRDYDWDTTLRRFDDVLQAAAVARFNAQNESVSA
jgi:hypothetical protein